MQLLIDEYEELAKASQRRPAWGNAALSGCPLTERLVASPGISL
jgi:hypothetical protein